MQDIYRISASENGLSPDEIRAALLESLAGRTLKKVLILPPDFTRYHSNAGFITNVFYHTLCEMGAQVDILPALGNEFITIIKETSLASTFFVGDLMTSYLTVNGKEFLPLQCLLIVGIIYFILTFILGRGVSALERRLSHD